MGDEKCSEHVSRMRDNLHAAVRNNDLLNVNQLLLEGTDANILNEDGRTALCIALENGFIGIVDVLLNHGADPNKIVDDNGFTALQIALNRGCIRIVNTLLDHNADPNLVNYCGSALHYIIQIRSNNEKMDKLMLLLDYLAHPDVKNYKGDSALHVAVRMNNIDMVRKLLDCGADPNSTNHNGESVLCTASSFRVAYLVEHDIDVSLRIVKALLEAGADVAATDGEGCTALHLTSHAEVALCLLEKGAAIDAKDNGGRTPLHYAAALYVEDNNPMEPLLFAGANIDIPDEGGITPFHLCENLENRGINFVLLKFHALNIRRNVTSRFDLNRLQIPQIERYFLYFELEKGKFTKIEGVYLYNVLKHAIRDISLLRNIAFRNVIDGDGFKKDFPKLYLLTRMRVREAEIRKPLVEELSEMFAYKLSTTMAMNAPQDVCRLIIVELEFVDIKNLQIAIR